MVCSSFIRFPPIELFEIKMLLLGLTLTRF
jgi:hypothetical protein